MKSFELPYYFLLADRHRGLFHPEEILTVGELLSRLWGMTTQDAVVILVTPEGVHNIPVSVNLTAFEEYLRVIVAFHDHQHAVKTGKA